ncbi:beta strand repeat-containing protein [uncultured Enterovirga sp.]|uniref:beta strand repeat-containing protein n=1 Tax=uncultured Enterovirga sp. TaxID=2026352 RepID=UPI0035CAE9B1
MATRIVGPNSTYPTITAALADIGAGPGDVIQLETGYSNEAATIPFNNITVFGDASSLGITLQLGTGVPTFTLTGTAPITVFDAIDGNGIVGNAGDNTVLVRSGVDAVDGGLGVDRLVVDYSFATGAVTGDALSNFTEAGGGGRTVTVTAGTFENFSVLTGAGADTITTYDGNDFISTGLGAGTVSAGQGQNTILGGADADTITALDGGNLVDGGDGTNTITTGGGIDTILSGTGADTIVSGAGSDTITVRGGADSVTAGAESDLLIVDYSTMITNVTGGVTAGNLGSGYVGQIADLAVSTLGFQGVENFTIATGTGNDAIQTGDGVDSIYTSAGNDVLTSGGGDDILVGGSGNDVMTGGGGNDLYQVSEAADDVVEGLGAGVDQVYASVDYGLTANVENLFLLGSAAIGIGNASDNYITAALEGSVDNVLIGGGGNDQMVGGLGNDLYEVMQAGDTVIEAVGEGADQIYAYVDHTLSANVENLFLVGSATSGTGNGLDNYITASLEGAVDNVLNGGGGNDVMVGGLGNDLYAVTEAGDIVVEAAGAGGDQVYAFIDYVLSDNVENLFLAGSAANGTGNALSNYINAGLTGNLSNVLNGGAGNDALVGGGGSDTFAFSAAAFGRDTIMDFSTAQDQIALSQADFTDFGSVMANASQVGTSTVIDLNANSSITLENVTVAELQSSQFLFV